MMTLEEAIEHCAQKACGSRECAKEYKQLAEWLKELQAIKMNIKTINLYNETFTRLYY